MKLISLVAVVSVLVFASILSGCDKNGTPDETSEIIPGCSPAPVAAAPDIFLCPGFDQAQLEEIVDETGGGCECDSDCETMGVVSHGDEAYMVTCSNDCGTDIARGNITCIRWVSDWEDAQAQAKAQNKPIMINFYTDVCPACKQLDQNTFSDQELALYLNENFINHKSNAQKTGLYTKYRVTGVPTTVFTEPDGTGIDGIIGFATTLDFFDLGQKVLDYWDKNKDQVKP